MTDISLSASKIRELFGDAPDGRRFVSIGNDHNVSLKAGDWVRVIAYNTPSFLDALWDSAQENAEEHTGEVLNAMQAQGVLAIMHQVQGKAVARADGTSEVYIYDVEIVDFFDPVNATSAQGGSFAFSAAAVASVLFAAAALTVSIKIATVETHDLVDAANKATDAASGIAFWIGIAVVAASIAYIVGKTKGATSNG